MQDREETSSQRQPNAGPDAGGSAVGTTGRWTGGSAVGTTGRWTGGSAVEATGRWTGSAVGTTGRGRRNRPDVGKQRLIEYREVPGTRNCNRTCPVAGDRTLAASDQWFVAATVGTTRCWTGGSVVGTTGCWTSGSAVGTTGRGRRNRPNVGKQRPIEYREVPERRNCDRTLAASD